MRDHHGATSFDLTAAGTAQHSHLPPEGTPRAEDARKDRHEQERDCASVESGSQHYK